MLSVVIIAKNEEDRIRTCFESVKWADEVVVYDNGSVDKTLDIAKKYTNKIFTSRDLDFATLRNKAMEEASGDWVLYVDPDERVLEPLREEIGQLMETGISAAYAISRKNIIFGREVRFGPFWPDWVIRLIKKSNFEGWVGKIHEQPKFNGKLGYTKNSLLHLTHRDLDQIVLKSLEWSKIEANLRLEAAHPKMSGWRFVRILFGELFSQGIRRRGFFHGSVGTMDSLLQTFSMLMTYIRLWQLQQPKPMDKIYDDLDKELLNNNFKH